MARLASMQRVSAFGALAVGVLLAGCVSSSSSSARGEQESGDDAAQYNMQLGVSYLRQGKLEAAREKLERAIRQEPGLATAHSALGVVYERLEDPDGAERQYRRAVDLSPNDPDTLNTLAVFTCSRLRKPEQALRIFDRAIGIPLSVKNANRAMLYTNAGTCAKALDLERAETYLRGAIGHDARYPDALFQLAEVSLQRDNPLQARGFLERYLAAAKPSPEALWLGVRIEQQLHDGVAARGYADKLRKSFPDSSETRLLLEQQAGGRG